MNARYTLVADLDASNTVAFSGCVAVIDLAGHTWDCSDVALDVDAGAEVTVIDSVGGGKVSANNDAIRTIGNGKLTLRGITVDAYAGGCDAVFTQDGVVLVEDCTLNAKQASVHNDNRDGATVTVISCVMNGETVALKGRNNAVVTVGGNMVFNNRKVEMQRGFDANRSVVDTFKAGENATIEFDSIVVGNNATTTIKNYTYTAPAKDPAFASATIEISNGIALDFIVTDATDTTVVMVNGVELPSHEYEGNTAFVLEGFGPQAMGDEFTAELYVDGAYVTSTTYSVKAYCDTVLKTSSDETLKNLVREVLVYGAKAQAYKNYKKDAPVDDGIVSTGEYIPPEVVTNILSYDGNVTVTWDYATVVFGDTVELVVALNGDADKIVVNGGDEYAVVDGLATITGFTPAQFRDTFNIVAFNGDAQVSNTLQYSVGSYVADRVQNSTNTAFVELVQALMVYGDAVAAYVA